MTWTCKLRISAGNLLISFSNWNRFRSCNLFKSKSSVGEFTSFAIWQNTDLAKCLSHLPIPRLLGALGTLLLTLSAHFPVRSATGMLFKMEENGCISPVDLLIPGISGVQ